MQVTVIINPKKKDIGAFMKLYPRLDPSVAQKIQNNNIRIELHKHEKYIFMVDFIPEYLPDRHIIKSTEVNIFFDKVKRKAFILGFDTNHFFQHYHTQIHAIDYTSFGNFIEQWLQIALEDEARIIEHLLQDTKAVRDEYLQNADPTVVMRHLTGTLINITTLRLVINNQEKLLTHVESYIRDYEDSVVNYKRTYINEELQYAREFCETLMNSINTKYQVKMSDTFYAYTKYTFIIFLASAVFQIAYSFVDDPSPIKLTFWFCSLLTLLGTLVMFRRFG